MSNLAIGSLKDSFSLSLEEFIHFEEILFDNDDVATNAPKKYPSLEKIEDVFRSIIPLSLPEKGKDHRTIQLWKYKKGLIASDKIKNALNPGEKQGQSLMSMILFLE